MTSTRTTKSKKRAAGKASPSSKTPRNVEGRFQKPADAKAPINAVFYGPSGSGKTTLAASFPKPLLHIDIGEKTAEVLEGFDNLQTVEVSSQEELDDIYWWLHDHPEKFRSVVIDTMGQYQDLLVNARSAGGTKSMTIRDWGLVSGSLKTDIHRFVALPLCAVFIAHDRVFKIDSDDEDDELPGSVITMPEVGPAMMPSVAKVLNASVGILGNTFILERTTRIKKKVKGKLTAIEDRKVDYGLRLGPHAVYRSKVRKPLSVSVPPYILNPGYEKLVQVMQGRYTGE